MKEIDSIYQIDSSTFAVDISESMSDTTENQNDKTIQDQKLIPLK